MNHSASDQLDADSGSGRAEPHRTIGWRDAMRIATDAASPNASESIPIDEALGRVSAADLHTMQAVPHFASAAMDGWAVAGTGPWLIDDPVTAPGSAFTTARSGLEAGHAEGIVTGGLVPAGTTAVLRSEHALTPSAQPGQQRHLSVGPGARAGEPLPGQHIRLPSEEARAGELVIAAGAVINPAHIALAALAAHDEISVIRRPRVRFVFTGDEVIEHGIPEPGRVRDTFGPQLPALLRLHGAEVIGRLRVGDSLPATVDALEQSLSDSQLVITTGGTGRSSADHLRRAVGAVGGATLFDGINVRPGGPTLLAMAPNGSVIVCLPGNPLAAMAALVITVIPLVRVMAGRASTDLMTTVVGADTAGRTGSTLLMPFMLVGGRAFTSAWQGSAMMRGLADADGFLEVPPEGLVAGDRAKAIAVPWR
ncbi:molybdopterin molybdotransferase MoeA [Subtercola vilae]|uniref:Molybdopterin molybdenumtransferase n=1 Tax=Subtercola vilae TaxID=2056433 RepID=A0A4T2C4Z6_9MICO|nr:molybdopterin molybdotransferase MoeA [Subtercola vilae]TIH39415.1 molybdopterin molybdenumtransferase MoeA [Subtercola vilae]